MHVVFTYGGHLVTELCLIRGQISGGWYSVSEQLSDNIVGPKKVEVTRDWRQLHNENFIIYKCTAQEILSVSLWLYGPFVRHWLLFQFVNPIRNLQ
jgi:hypothetical protein